MKAQWEDLAAMVLIGDGILNLVQPTRHTLLWSCGPKFYKETSRKLVSYPGVARGIGFTLIGIGLWLGRNAVADQIP